MKLLFLFPFSIALVLAAIGVYLIRSHEQLLAVYTHETRALISEMRRRGKYHCPVFEYDYSGQHYRKVSTIGTSPPLYQVGQSVRIKLNPENPEKFVVVDEKSQILFLWFCSVLRACSALWV